MVFLINGNLVGPISPTSGCIPLNVILTPFCCPNWNLDSLDGNRTSHLLNDDIESTCTMINILDTEFSARWQSCCTWGHTNQMTTIIFIVEMDIVESQLIFMVFFVYFDLIGSICLTVSYIPKKIILSIFLCPNRQLYRTNAWRIGEIINGNVNGTSCYIRLNFKIAFGNFLNSLERRCFLNWSFTGGSRRRSRFTGGHLTSCRCLKLTCCRWVHLPIKTVIL